jgi:hypothetical protein
MKKLTRKQRRQKVKQFTLMGLHQSLISRILDVSTPTVRTDQRALGLPPRIQHGTRPYRKNAFAKKLVAEAVQRFFGGQLPQDTNQLAKIMTNFPETVPDKLKNKMTDEQWGAYRTHLTDNIVAAIRAREARQYVN